MQQDEDRICQFSLCWYSADSNLSGDSIIRDVKIAETQLLPLQLLSTESLTFDTCQHQQHHSTAVWTVSNHRGSTLEKRFQTILWLQLLKCEYNLVSVHSFLTVIWLSLCCGQKTRHLRTSSWALGNTNGHSSPFSAWLKDRLVAGPEDFTL